VSSEYMEPWVTDIIRGADSALLVADSAAVDCLPQLEQVLEILQVKKIALDTTATPAADQGPVRHLPTVVLAGKMDLDGAARGMELLRSRFSPAEVVPFSALEDDYSRLGQAIFRANAIVRVYSKSPGKDPDRSRPFVMHRGDTLLDFARVVHKDFAEKLRYARVWGTGKFAGQRIQRDQELADGDVIELHM